jgi:2-polyprenyl-6-methoxyphenol hydroxylase-like FAD-dependent oxidoreductase
MRPFKRRLTGDVAIVGGSLSGLATGIGFARVGIPVTVFEQYVGAERGGTGLGVDRDLITATTGVNTRVDGITQALPVVSEGYRDTSTWLAIYRWLRAVAELTPGLTIVEDTSVDNITSVGDGVKLSGSKLQTSASVVIGADGYRSVVRKAVSPGYPYAAYGGFVLWRALVDESSLPQNLISRASLGGGIGHDAKTARLVIYRVPGPNGETSTGKRSITLAWYDASRTSWLRQHGYLRDIEVLGSVPSAAIDAELRNELLTLAMTHWSGPARAVLNVAIKDGLLFGTPLAEYLPGRLVSARVALAGDAAHVASPMVGAGFSSGLIDGASLVAAVRHFGGTAGMAGVSALERFETERLLPNRERVLESLARTRELLQLVL